MMINIYMIINQNEHNIFERGKYIGLKKGNEVDYHYGVDFSQKFKIISYEYVYSDMM